VEHFQKLLSDYPTWFSRVKSPLVQILPAIEGASSFASETEPLAQALERLESYQEAIGPPVYISLTWEGENRFGGGNCTDIGLKEDGKRLLEWMSGKGIALDFSHTSDRLAYDLFNYIEKQALDLPVIASHSNFRAISNFPRNLPDAIAREIIRRGGLIGLNFFSSFIHPTDPNALLRHVEYGLSLKGEDALAFGADFFCDADAPNLLQKYQKQEAYYPNLSDASCYPGLLEQLATKLGLGEEILLKLANQNASHFISVLIKKSNYSFTN
jgi:microsomal dipeptidase-like Zn-dependent dipeptidase